MTCCHTRQAIFGQRPFNGSNVAALRKEQQRWVRPRAVPSIEHLYQQ